MAQPATSAADELRRLAVLAGPVVLAHLGSMLMGVVDVFMVGQLGDGPLAAVSLGHTYSFAFQFPLLGVAIGLDPLFAQAFGANQPHRAGAALARGAAVLALLSLPVIGLHLVSGPLLLLAGQEADIVREATPYIWVRALAVVPFAGFSLLRQFMQGSGRMWAGTIAIVVGNLINVVLNGCLLFGWFSAPTLGPVGTAWATVGSTGAMALCLLVILGRDLRRAAPSLADFITVGPMLALLGVSLPIGAQMGLEGWAFSISTIMVGTFGETPLAAHTVALTLSSVAFMVPLGISSAAATRVGNLVGAGLPWARAAWLSVAMGSAAMCCFSAAFFIFPATLAGWFVSGPQTLALASLLVPIAAGFALFDGIQVVSFGALRGAGDTTMPAAANIIGYYFVGLPLGALLGFGYGYGAMGIWVGLATALACVAGLLLTRLLWTQRRGARVVG